MCECSTKSAPKKTPYPEKKHTLKEFFDLYWNRYLESPKQHIKPEHFKAVNAIRLCRTDALGKDIYACTACGDTVELLHNCKNRFCPTCSWKDTLKWGERMQNMLMNVPHRHVVFTLPHSLNSLIRLNQKDLTNALMSISGHLITDYLLKEHGIKAGVIAVLHTFGEKKNLHVHVHMIVSWGGERVCDNGLKVMNNPYVKYDELKERFKNGYIKVLSRLYKKKELVHRFASNTDFENFINKLKTHKWILHFEDPMKIPTQVITYIGRYSKRACISEYKILDISQDHITFGYKDYKDKDDNGKIVEKELRLHYSEFIPLLLQHVPLPYFRLVRYYGAYNALSGVNKRHLFVKSDSKATGDPEPASQVQDQTDTIYCRSCKSNMLYIASEVNRKGINWQTYKKLELLKRHETKEKNVA